MSEVFPFQVIIKDGENYINVPELVFLLRKTAEMQTSEDDGQVVLGIAYWIEQLCHTE